MNSDPPVSAPTFALTGTVGAGNSIAATESNDTLTAFKIPNNNIDLDTPVWQWPSTSKWNDDLMFENLACLWSSRRQQGRASCGEGFHGQRPVKVAVRTLSPPAMYYLVGAAGVRSSPSLSESRTLSNP